MSRKLTPQSSLENLKREAKRWLKAIQSGDDAARARFAKALPNHSAPPTLRDVQHALAVEHGVAGWTDLKDALKRRPAREASARDDAVQELLSAADRGDVERVSAVLDAHPDIVNERAVLPGHTGRRSALHFAMNSESWDVANTLLLRGADPNLRDDGDNAMPLHFAAEKGNLGIVELLIEHGADPIGAGDTHELEVIGWATSFDGVFKPKVAEYLLAHGARHNIFSAVSMGDVAAIRAIVARSRAELDRAMDGTNHRRHPVHLAVVKQRPESLAALLELGPDLEARDAAGLTALDQAALNSEAEMARTLIEGGAHVELPAAIALGRTADIQRLMRENPDALKPGERWGSLILRAAGRANGAVIDALVSHGASVNVEDDPTTAVDSTHGYTPLHEAAFRGNWSAATALLARGASATTRDSKYASTPAGWANYARHQELRDAILKGPIDMFDAIAFDLPHRIREVFDRDPAAINRPFGRYLSAPLPAEHWWKAWWTPLAYAAVNDKYDAARALLDLGAETTVRDPENRSLIDIARDAGHDRIVRLLESYEGGSSDDTAADSHASEHAKLIARFLSNACPDHHVRGRPAHSIAKFTADRLLETHPEIARDSIYTAVVCGDLETVRRLLAARPELAREKGGPKGSAGGQGWSFVLDTTAASHPKWEPLLYLCFTRLSSPAVERNAIEIARLLLDNGADPNAYFMAGDSRYSPMTGVVGEGEENRPPHPKRNELVRLLLDRGANPYDIQVFYNIHFHGHVLWFLEILYEHTVKAGRGGDWKDPQWSMINMGGYGLGARYCLMIAVNHNDLTLAKWILDHGADPNAELPARTRLPKVSLHEAALRRGFKDMADLLEQYGAKATAYVPVGEEAFVDASLRLDRPAMQRILAEHPEYLTSTKAVFEAARRDRADIVGLLLDLGTPIEVESPQHGRALHEAAYHNSLNVAKLLIEQGAEIDPVEDNYGNSPMDFARYAGNSEMIDILAPHSRDLWSLAFAGKVDRLRELLSEEPQLARAVWSNNTTPLMRLPNDGTSALEIVELFLHHGADPTIRNSDGFTAADLAERRGLDEAAAALRGL